MDPNFIDPNLLNPDLIDTDFCNFDEIALTMEIKVVWGEVTQPLVIPVSATIIKIKEMIFECLSIPVQPERQELTWEGQFLRNDDFTLQNYGIPPDRATITVLEKIQAMTIKVLWAGMKQPLVITVSARIIEVKQLIFEYLKIPIHPERQELAWEALFLRNDHFTVQRYGIPPFATLTVYNKVLVKVNVGIHGGGRFHQHPFVIYSGASVGELKKMIEMKIGVDTELKWLRLGKDDLDDRSLLWAAGISEGTVLHLMERSDQRFG